MKKWFVLFIGAIILLLASSRFEVYAQGNGIVYIDPNRGAKEYRKELIMNSNQVESIIGNWGIFGKRDHPYSGVWPRGTGHGHVHEMTLLVAAAVTGVDGNPYQIVSESYSEPPADRSPDGTDYWWNPLPGYANDNRRFVDPVTGKVDTTAMIATSTDRTTWPSTWPGKDPSWNGRWNGYFGKDQFNADQECIYVIDDLTNKEFPYYPIASDSTRRGLGLQVEARLFQWSHPLAEDQIFIHYQITNTSKNAYNRNIYLGAFADTHPGGLGAADDNSGFNKDEDMVFAWDNDNIGVWGQYRNILPGYTAWKYLESPGLIDGIDNDNDGLLDERRDNDAGQLIFGPVGIYDEAKEHWSGDEDGDWDPLVDDTGSDGLGPYDPNYDQPDADGTEGNGRPDQGEPNFGFTDNDESDQMGLTSFYSPPYGAVTSRNDEQVWSYIQPGTFETPAQNANNLWIFASGAFILEPQRTERFSVCWLFGQDEIEIFRNAVTSQRIYDNDYRFTKPPLPPVVKAVPGNRKVTLYWNALAERSRDPVYGFDFEGYRIYKGTNSQMSESQQITDAYGSLAYRKPIAQFDLKDGIKGLHPVALGAELGAQYSTGIHYYMGDDGGLKYFYEDTQVQNGVTYYYAVVAYDKGYFEGMDDRHLVPMTPAESPFKITYEFGALKEISSNAVIATPNAPATNYNPGYTDADESGYIKSMSGSNTTGRVQVLVIDPDQLPDQSEFEISFTDEVNELAEIETKTYSVKNITTGEMIYDAQPVPLDLQTEEPQLSWPTTIFSGMLLNFENTQPDINAIQARSGWTDNSQTNLVTEIQRSSSGLIASNFIVEITSEPAHRPFNRDFQVYFKVYDSFTADTLDFFFTRDANQNRKIEAGDIVSTLYQTNTGRRVIGWRLIFNAPPGVPSSEIINPQPGDKFVFVSDSPFKQNDNFRFKTFASTSKTVTSEVLNQVAVVPNPYILAAAWEQQTGVSGRGERKIYFIHLPAACTIRIFTQNGVLLKTIVHAGLQADGSESWDITTDEGLEVAFGIYVFHVEAPGIGQKVGTFAIIN